MTMTYVKVRIKYHFFFAAGFLAFFSSNSSIFFKSSSDKFGSTELNKNYALPELNYCPFKETSINN